MCVCVCVCVCVCEVEGRYGGRVLVLLVHVVVGGGPNLMGRDRFSHFDVGLRTMNLVDPDGQLGAIPRPEDLLCCFHRTGLCTRTPSEAPGA